MRRRTATQNPFGAIIVVIGILVALFVSLVFNALRGNTAMSTTKNTHVTDTQPHLAVADSHMNPDLQDTDGDGLQDWEEVLWSTDAHASDTDGDGVSDGNEVLKGGNPTRFGSNAPTENPEQVASTGIAQTATQAVARELMTSVMHTMQDKTTSDMAIDPNTMIETALKRTRDFMVTTPFTAQEVMGVESNTSTRNEYILEIEKVFISMTTGHESEVQTLQRLAQETNRGDALRTLENTTREYARLLETFKKVRVPGDAITVHTELVNALIDYNNTLTGIVAFDSDPVRAAASLNLFTVREQQLVVALDNLKRYLENNLMLPNTNAVER